MQRNSLRRAEVDGGHCTFLMSSCVCEHTRRNNLAQVWLEDFLTFMCILFLHGPSIRDSPGNNVQLCALLVF